MSLRPFAGLVWRPGRGIRPLSGSRVAHGTRRRLQQHGSLSAKRRANGIAHHQVPAADFGDGAGVAIGGIRHRAVRRLVVARPSEFRYVSEGLHARARKGRRGGGAGRRGCSEQFRSAQGPGFPSVIPWLRGKPTAQRHGLLVSGVGIRRGASPHVRHETSRLHHAARRRSCVAARGACAATAKPVIRYSRTK